MTVFCDDPSAVETGLILIQECFTDVLSRVIIFNVRRDGLACIIVLAITSPYTLQRLLADYVRVGWVMNWAVYNVDISM